MGLAEHSKFNPLKTLHAKLEIDEGNEDEKIAFVGISNWSLDASKMNRGIHISISDLDIEDNIETALTIAESYDKLLIDNDNDKKYFEILDFEEGVVCSLKRGILPRFLYRKRGKMS